MNLLMGKKILIRGSDNFCINLLRTTDKTRVHLLVWFIWHMDMTKENFKKGYWMYHMYE